MMPLRLYGDGSGCALPELVLLFNGMTRNDFFSQGV